MFLKRFPKAILSRLKTLISKSSGKRCRVTVGVTSLLMTNSLCNQNFSITYVLNDFTNLKPLLSQANEISGGGRTEW